MPKYLVEISAYKRVSCSVVVEAEDETDAQTVADAAYNMMDGSEFIEDPDYWEHGDTYVHGPAGGDKVQYYRDTSGTVRELVYPVEDSE